MTGRAAAKMPRTATMAPITAPLVEGRARSTSGCFGSLGFSEPPGSFGPLGFSEPPD
ncbi:hypothetical protein [Corynebacterium diphtheriae]|uniref:hypothetical protein n=1 Tax=Corynebacterium diphtheriae TaxID=1717 RepID=UPI0015F26EE0|nr:hypothetical protein [Corynebacterium diphtheriae]